MNETSQILPSRGSQSIPREESLHLGVVGCDGGEPWRESGSLDTLVELMENR